MDIPEYEQNLDQLFSEAFDVNHPALLDWAEIKMELKRLRKENKNLTEKDFVP